MIGLIRSRRWAQWLAALMVATIGLFAIAAPVRAADTGTIEGGVFIVDVKGSKIKIDDKNSKVTLSPTASEAQISVNDGRIKITNVPVGTYTVNLAFKLTKDACPGLLQGIGIGGGLLTAPLSLFCRSDIKDTYYGFSKSWTATVTNGATTFLEGSDANGNKELGVAIQTTASGNPVVDCSGKGIIMSFAICPAIENMLGIIDWIIDNFIQPYLAINPLTPMVNGEESVIYKVWNNIRNFANIVFIGLFFIIVFSQATSIGISNYGIKRLLPRLVLIAIGTNVSFFICALMIDISNVFGAGIASLLVSSVINGSPQIIIGSDLFDILLQQGGPVGGMTSLLAQGVLGAAIIFGMFLFLLFAVLMLLIAAVVVLMRQVILIFMVLASPLAFIAGLLPNTQRTFNQWFITFARLLAMYPIMMGLLAAGKIASTVLNQVGQ